MTTFGEFIKKTRDARDLSLREMAKLVDCSPAFLSDIELGKRYPSDSVLSKIAQVLKIKKSDLEALDMRSTVDDFKRATIRNPHYAFAFRRVLEKNVDSEELLKLINKMKEGKK